MNRSNPVQIKKYKRVFMRFCHENAKAQKYFMGGFEKTVELRKEKLLNKVPVILKTLYDEDVIDEENILEWAKKVGGSLNLGSIHEGPPHRGGRGYSKTDLMREVARGWE